MLSVLADTTGYTVAFIIWHDSLQTFQFQGYKVFTDKYVLFKPMTLKYLAQEQYVQIVLSSVVDVDKMLEKQ